ncbi:hypothetical protein FB451DRAFT_1372019 [Mycena latifolia]|nr:hypothetical protein FB451DRAFT_1372019 [Mycena latifolia]
MFGPVAPEIWKCPPIWPVFEAKSLNASQLWLTASNTIPQDSPSYPASPFRAVPQVPQTPSISVKRPFVAHCWSEGVVVLPPCACRALRHGPDTARFAQGFHYSRATTILANNDMLTRTESRAQNPNASRGDPALRLSLYMPAFITYGSLFGRLSLRKGNGLGVKKLISFFGFSSFSALKRTKAKQVEYLIHSLPKPEAEEDEDLHNRITHVLRLMLEETDTGLALLMRQRCMDWTSTLTLESECCQAMRTRRERTQRAYCHREIGEMELHLEPPTRSPPRNQRHLARGPDGNNTTPPGTAPGTNDAYGSMAPAVRGNPELQDV